MDTKNLPWVEKYRPTTFEELSAQKDIISTIDRFIDEHKLPHLLFYGPPGTGKTTTILACARKIYGNNYRRMVLELNASDDRGIDVVRNQIKEFASTKQMFQNANYDFKLIILDEADSMTSAAQAALRRVIEKYARNVRFCLIGNYVGKIIPAIQSRCSKFRFSPLSQNEMEKRLSFIATEEHISITECGKNALLRLASGDMRKLLNILQATFSSFDSVTEENVYLCVGRPLPSDISRISQWLLHDDFSKCLFSINKLQKDYGYALLDIITDVFQVCLNSSSISQESLSFLIENIADIERHLASGCNEKIQLAHLIGAFILARS